MNINHESEAYLARIKHPKALVCGVAARLAEKFEWSCLWTRIVGAVVILFNPTLGLLAYFVLALLLPKWERKD